MATFVELLVISICWLLLKMEYANSIVLSALVFHCDGLLPISGHGIN